MRKIVSTEKGISLFFDEEGCVAYETGKHMTGADVGRYLDLSRAVICQSLKKSMKNIFYKIKRKTRASTLEIVCTMASEFNCKSEKEYRKFFKLFPQNVKEEIYAAAKKAGYFN
jgi:hypothetical protein